MQTKTQLSSDYREITIKGTLYRLKSVFEGEKDLDSVLERLAIKKALESTAAGVSNKKSAS